MIYALVNTNKEIFKTIALEELDPKQIMEGFKFESMDWFGRVIDCNFIIDDTQVAKSHIYKHGIGGVLKDPDVGDLYLRLYGCLNAVYMQYEVLKELSYIIGYKYPDAKLNAIPKIIEFRNAIAAHSSSKRIKGERRSFFLSRQDLRTDDIHSISYNTGHQPVTYNANIKDLLKEWDKHFFTWYKKTTERLLEFSYLKDNLLVIKDKYEKDISSDFLRIEHEII